MRAIRDIVYCDNHLLVVEKVAGVATQPDVVEEAKAWVKKEFNKPGNVFLEPAHRLDKPVSGLVLLARTSKALSRLNEQMRGKSIVKVYRARLVNEPKEKKGRLRHFLIHDDFFARVDESGKIGKEAILDYEVVGEREVSIKLVTGRYHQIRAQFSAIGCPIVGDKKYGGGGDGKEIMLCHVGMEIEHPVKKERIWFRVG